MTKLPTPRLCVRLEPRQLSAEDLRRIGQQADRALRVLVKQKRQREHQQKRERRE